MTKLRNMLSAAVMCLALAACGTTGTAPPVTTTPPPAATSPPAGTVQSDAVKAAVAVLTIYGNLYQPAVLAYGGLPDCPGAILCKDRPTVDRLKAVDKTASALIAAARPILTGATAGTGVEVQAAVKAVLDAESAIAASGAFHMLKGSTS